MIRPGGVLYGLWRDVLPAKVDASELKPVMSLHSRISLLKWVPAGETIGYGCTFEASRKTLVATIPIGYDDGYPRAMSNRGPRSSARRLCVGCRTHLNGSDTRGCNGRAGSRVR